MHPVRTASEKNAQQDFFRISIVWTIRPGGTKSAFKVRNRDGITVENRSSADLPNSYLQLIFVLLLM